MTTTEQKVRELVKEDRQMLRVKRRMLRILLELPDDESRARVLGAAAVLLGHADAVLHDR